MSKKTKSKSRTGTRPLIVSVCRTPQPFRIPELNLGVFQQTLTYPVDLQRPDSAQEQKASQTLYVVVEGPRCIPCSFEKNQFVMDAFSDSNPVPVFDLDTALRLIRQSVEYRYAKNFPAANYRAVPVFQMTVYND